MGEGGTNDPGRRVPRDPERVKALARTLLRADAMQTGRGAPSARRILIVDDDAHAADGLRMLLELDGYSVVALRSATAALERLRTDWFDAVVTDLEMKEHSGLELISLAQARSAPIPVIVMTGHFGSPVCDEALRSGASAVFAKPVDYDGLTAELAKTLA